MFRCFHSSETYYSESTSIFFFEMRFDKIHRLLVLSPQTELVHYCLEDQLLIYQTPFNYLHQALVRVQSKHYLNGFNVGRFDALTGNFPHGEDLYRDRKSPAARLVRKGLINRKSM